MIENTGDMSPQDEDYSEQIWRRIDTGEQKPFSEFGVGAMWFENIDGYYYRPGPDGKSLSVRTPGGDWRIDSRASNCTMPDENDHRCWVRHGIPPMITVDKIGNTCKAGAGSIQMGQYHGFLINGSLTAC